MPGDHSTERRQNQQVCGLSACVSYGYSDLRWPRQDACGNVCVYLAGLAVVPLFDVADVEAAAPQVDAEVVAVGVFG
jgi:hypothetical protein